MSRLDSHDQARGMDRRTLVTAGGAAAIAAAGATVLGATPAGAAPLVPVLSPVNPQRVYDSRAAGALGPISNGQVDTLTSGPAADAMAYLLNVTVVNTTGFGWISVFSADLASTTSSTLNWYGPNQTMVNTAYTWIRTSDSGIKVSCGGGGSTQYILDLTGVLFMYDAGAAMSVPSAVGSDTSGRGLTGTRQ